MAITGFIFGKRRGWLLGMVTRGGTDDFMIILRQTRHPPPVIMRSWCWQPGVKCTYRHIEIEEIRDVMPYKLPDVEALVS